MDPPQWVPHFVCVTYTRWLFDLRTGYILPSPLFSSHANRACPACSWPLKISVSPLQPTKQRAQVLPLSLWALSWTMSGWKLASQGIRSNGFKPPLPFSKQKVMHPKGIAISYRDFELCMQSYLPPPRGSFLQRMVELTHKVSKLHHHIKLSSGFFKDLTMWQQFIYTWNGAGFLLSPS